VTWSGRRRLGTLRTQALVGLGVCLVVATAVSIAFDARTADRRLEDEARALVDDALQVAAALVADARSQLRTSLRSNVQALAVRGVGSGTDPVVLRREAGTVQRSIGVDGIAFVDADGMVVASSGLEPPDGAVVPTRGSTAAHVFTGAGEETAEGVAVAVDDGLWVVGIRAFGDARAFELRRLLAGDEVVLVHDGVVTGRTSDDLAGLDEVLDVPTQPAEIRLRGQVALIGFAPVGESAAIGIITLERLQGLAGDLATSRLLALLVLLLVALAVGDVLLRVITRPLIDLAETAEAVQRGDVDRRFTARPGDEIGRLADTLEAMRCALNDQVRLISLQADAIRRATQRIVTARDVERRRMAQDLHDGVQQQLVMLRLRVGLLDELSADQRAALGRDVDAAITQVRETSQAIFPSILSDRGLSGALYSLTRAAVLPVELDLRPDPLPRLPEAVEAGAYFIASEAMANVTKHAGAARMRIRVRAGSDGVLLVVSDCGRGFDVAAASGGSGLQNLRDRAVALGGVAHVRSEPGVGTVVAVRLPVPSALALGALQVEQDGGDAAVEVVGVAEAELAEDGVGVLLDRALADDELLRDR
jgi:signal transduction histidine kinase